MPVVDAVMSKRSWLVPNVSVWGVSQEATVDFITVEESDSGKYVLAGSLPIGSSLQEIAYGDLRDHRGNTLPASIASPHVIPRPRSETPVFVVGQETDTAFRIARDSRASGPVTVDLLIVEMDD